MGMGEREASSQFSVEILRLTWVTQTLVWLTFYQM